MTASNSWTRLTAWDPWKITGQIAEHLSQPAYSTTAPACDPSHQGSPGLLTLQRSVGSDPTEQAVPERGDEILLRATWTRWSWSLAKKLKRKHPSAPHRERAGNLSPHFSERLGPSGIMPLPGLLPDPAPATGGRLSPTSHLL